MSDYLSYKSAESCLDISSCHYWWCEHHKECLEKKLSDRKLPTEVQSKTAIQKDYRKAKKKALKTGRKVEDIINRYKPQTPVGPKKQFFKPDIIHGDAKFIFCHYCGGLISYDKITKDHKHPVSKNGSKRGRYNIVPACKSCNNEKSDMEYMEYLQYRYRSGKTLSRVATKDFENQMVIRQNETCEPYKPGFPC
jgi:5-methylcytosine-specific restriction endonuclease McrA